MREVILCTLTIVIAVITGGAWADESGVSQPQEWAFQMEKVWEIEKIGGDQLLRPAEPRISENGTLYFRDFERNKSYIIDPDGKPLGTFAPQGTNDGEVSFYFNCFPAGENVAVCAPDKIHFFTVDGKFLKAVPNNLFARFPLAFKNENEFWVAPGALGDAGTDSVAVIHVNCASGKETAIHKFALSAEERKPSGGGLVVGLTPQALMSFDRQLDMICFGKNTDTILYWLPAGGGEGGSLSFSGTRRPVSEADKRSHFAKFNIPEERVNTMIGILPDKMAYYHRMQIVDGLVYLFRADGIGYQTGQLVSVISRDGRYLYRGEIQVEQAWHLTSPDNLRLASGFVYAVQEDDAGNKKVVKYKVTLPRP